MQGVLGKKSKCGKEDKVWDFLHDCGTVDTYETGNQFSLKLKFRKYPSIHTNCIISHSTILQYNHNI